MRILQKVYLKSEPLTLEKFDEILPLLTTGIDLDVVELRCEAPTPAKYLNFD